jgi:hypothetical protein
MWQTGLFGFLKTGGSQGRRRAATRCFSSGLGLGYAHLQQTNASTQGLYHLHRFTDCYPDTPHYILMGVPISCSTELHQRAERGRDPEGTLTVEGEYICLRHHG